MENAIKIENLSKTFKEDGRQVEALKSINLEIETGEFFILLGPSGCGKSTLLRLIAGFDKQFEGTIEFSETIRPGDIGFVFQEFALFPWLSVYENIEISLLSGKYSEAEKKNLIDTEIERFGLNKFAKSYPRDLSGGMKQRVGIARAWVTSPKIIFMDEPFSELDSFTAEVLRGEVQEIWKERRSTIVMVTHLIPEAIELADRIAVMSPRPGIIEALIKNDIGRPRKKRSNEFFSLEDKLTKIVRP